MNANVRKLALVGALTGVLVLGTAASCVNEHPNEVNTEVEDCDAEDYRNRESECGFLKVKPTPTKTNTVPKPNTTRKK